MVGDQGLVAARLLASELHNGQQYGERPYTEHLQAVVDTLERFGATPGQPWSAPVVVAAWLHDSLEDTVITRSELASRFGEAVADLVWRVTDEPGENRAARKRATYAKTREDEMAVILKLADRIANVEAATAGNHSLLRMYRKEHEEFKAGLTRQAQSDVATRMWEYLDNLLIPRP